MTIGCAIAIVFLSISAYFCVRKRSSRNFSNATPLAPAIRTHINPTSNAVMQGPNANPTNPKSYAVKYTTNNGNISIRESSLPKSAPNPALVMTMPTTEIGDGIGDSGGFEYEGDRTKFATLQRQRKAYYDDSGKNRVQSLRRNLLSPSQFEGSAEKLIVNEMETSPQHYYAGIAGNFQGVFKTKHFHQKLRSRSRSRSRSPFESDRRSRSR